MTHSCSSHPSNSQERSSRPSLLSMGNPFMHWAATRGLLGNSGAAPPSGHRVRRRHLSPPSAGCYYTAWLFGCALWLSAWLVLVLGQARAHWRPLFEAVHSGRSGSPSAFNFHSFGCARHADLRHGVHVWRPGRAARRQRESRGKPWRPREWSEAVGRALSGGASE